MLTKLARIGLTVAVLVLAGSTFALAETSATPAPSVVVSQASPAPTASPNAFTWNGYVRAYDFYRQNAYSGHAAANQQSENNAISLTGNYHFMDSGFSVGASYLYANPFNGCQSTAANVSPAANSNACYQAKSAPNTNPDNTLPGFELSTMYQAFLQYTGNGFYFKGGNQVINTPWAPSSDSRLKPVAFQGVDLTYHLNPEWTVEGSDYWQWECRTCSDFDHGTLLTTLSPVPKLGGGVAFNGYSGANAYPANYFDPTFQTYTNNGFFYGRVGYNGASGFPLAANLYYYAFDNIANAFWADAKYPFASTGRFKAFIAAQGGSETNAGTALLGKIDSEIYGLQAGFNPLNNVTLTAGWNDIPLKTDNVTLPHGFKCSSTHTISSPADYAGNLPYFLPSSGTGNCSPGANGTTNLYYGGWASPYTDSYATDPLYTTSGTQGMIDRRSPGSALKIAATFLSDDKQLVVILGQTWYNYNNPAYAQSTTGTDFDSQYFFSHVPKTGLYHGFSFRVRLFSRSESTFPGSSAVGLFKYSRFQAEYDF